MWVCGYTLSFGADRGALPVASRDVRPALLYRHITPLPLAALFPTRWSAFSFARVATFDVARSRALADVVIAHLLCVERVVRAQSDGVEPGLGCGVLSTERALRGDSDLRRDVRTGALLT